MRELTELLATATAKADLDGIKALVLSGAGILKINNDLVLPNLSLLDLSNNQLVSISSMLRYFPNVWWVNITGNRIDVIDFDCKPLCLGSLQISMPAELDLSTLDKFKDIHILRLSLHTDPKYIYQEVLRIAQQLPLIWVLNDDYLPSNLLQVATSKQIVEQESQDVFNDGGSWNGVARFHERESNMICVVRELPMKGELIDSCRLDVLLEDYLDEVSYFHRYPGSNTQCPSGKKIPFINCTRLLHMDHVVRMDLSAVLTLLITINAPIAIFVDCLESRFGKYFSRSQLWDIFSLPLFAKTAVVNLIRRICRKEIIEYAKVRIIFNKAKMEDFQQDSLSVDFETPPLLIGSQSFRHLASIRRYCDLFDPEEEVSSSHVASLQQVTSDQQGYSELEMELLKVLPDVPTRTSSTRDDEGNDRTRGRYSSWVSLAARHTVVLLSRSKKCPSLTRAQTSKQAQDSYTKFLPVLQLAKMTYEDMDISGSGPRIDGRRASTRLTPNGGVLLYGQGLPNGIPQNLSWHVLPPASTIKTHRQDENPDQEQKSIIERNMTDDLSSIDDSKVLSVMSRSSYGKGARLPHSRNRKENNTNLTLNRKGSPSRDSVDLTSKQILG